MEDYYAVLGVSPTATQEEIKKAYRRLIREWHPDVCQKPNAHEQSIKIIEAHEILTNPETRRKYDSLRSQRHRQTARNTAYSSEHAEFYRDTQSARRTAEDLVQRGLEELLNLLVDAGRTIWRGEKAFVQEKYGFGARLKTGFLGVLLLAAILLTFTGVAAPVTVPSGLYIWYSLQHNGRFIGLSNFLSSTLMVTVILLALLLLFIALASA